MSFQCFRTNCPTADLTLGLVTFCQSLCFFVDKIVVVVVVVVVIAVVFVVVVLSVDWQHRR